MNKNNFQVSEYKKEYLNNVVDLWLEQYDKSYVEKRKVLFKWITEENPFKSDMPTYFLLFDNKRVIGMMGHMPLEMTLKGKQQMFCINHDILLAKEYRGKGLGKIFPKWDIDSSSFFAAGLWYNELNYRIFKKSGWLDIPNLYPFIKVYEPELFLKPKIKNILLSKTISVILKKILQFKELVRPRKTDHSIKILSIEKFDYNFDILFKKIAPQLGIVVQRSSQYLNWKFVKKPFNDYKKYAAFNSTGELVGYMIFKSEKHENGIRGKILDFIVPLDSPEVFHTLIEKCCKNLLADKLSYIEIVTSKKKIARLLKSNGFFKARTPLPFMAANWKKDFKKSFVASVENWYITGSDGDGDVYSVE